MTAQRANPCRLSQEWIPVVFYATGSFTELPPTRAALWVAGLCDDFRFIQALMCEADAAAIPAIPQHRLEHRLRMPCETMAKRKMLPPRASRVKKPGKPLEDLAGSVKFRRDLKALLKELEEGWDDM